MTTQIQHQSVTTSATVLPSSSAHQASDTSSQPSDRYTIHEAAELFAKCTKESYGVFLSRLIDAVHVRKIPAYLPGKHLRNNFDELGNPSDHVSIVRIESDAIYAGAINDWLDASEPLITWRFPNSSSSVATTQAKPLPRQRYQEQQIQRVIRELGCNPSQLPKVAKGTAGVKAAVRTRLNFSGPVFDKAWERLRSNGDIQDA